MTTNSVPLTDSTAQQAYEFVCLAAKGTTAAIESIIEQLSISSAQKQSIIDAFCDIEHVSFLSGFAMCEAMKNVPMFGGD